MNSYWTRLNTLQVNYNVNLHDEIKIQKMRNIVPKECWIAVEGGFQSCLTAPMTELALLFSLKWAFSFGIRVSLTFMGMEEVEDDDKWRLGSPTPHHTFKYSSNCSLLLAFIISRLGEGSLSHDAWQQKWVLSWRKHKMRGYLGGIEISISPIEVSNLG